MIKRRKISFCCDCRKVKKSLVSPRCPHCSKLHLWKDPAYRAKSLAQRKAIWKDSDYRDMQSKAHKSQRALSQVERLNTDPVIKRKVFDGVMKARDRISEKVKQARKDRPDWIENAASAIRKALANPEVSGPRNEAISAKAKARWSRQDFPREEIIEKIRVARSKQRFVNRNTKPEQLTQQFLNRHGILFQTHCVIDQVHPYHQFDIYVPRLRLMLEVNGCYWHSCPKCYPLGVKHVKFDSELEITSARAQKLGYCIRVLWECGIESGEDLDSLLNLVTKIERQKAEEYLK